jgi:hypothetical protein
MTEEYEESDGNSLIYTKRNYYNLREIGTSWLNGKPIKEYAVTHFFSKRHDCKFRKWGGCMITGRIYMETQCIMCGDGVWRITIDDGIVAQVVS